ncbi:phosphoribosylglycinamide formyltransferase [Candidatus Peribacteria bacterium]|nr:phosphoribosylglycinamide formyltransferase [Candidatus Peribacteria bacterium]
MQFVVLSSSRGTTFQAVLDRIADGSLTASCLGLVSDRADRGCVEKAKAAKLTVTVVERREGESRDEYDKRVHDAIIALKPSPGASRHPLPLRQEREQGGSLFIAALGWMSIFTPWFITQWHNKIINVHPALLPKFGGAGMYGDKVHQAVLDAKEKQSGITIHLMDEGVDTGKILLQKTCSVNSEDTVESLKARVQNLEKEWYPKVLEMVNKREIKL